jgi:hypothetical protein
MVNVVSDKGFEAELSTYITVYQNGSGDTVATTAPFPLRQDRFSNFFAVRRISTQTLQTALCLK